MPEIRTDSLRPLHSFALAHKPETAAGGGRRSTPHPSKARLTAGRSELVELMQVINFGRVEGLTIRDGEPILDPLPRIVREVKFGGDNGPRPELGSNDFALKSQVVELFRHLDELH